MAILSVRPWAPSILGIQPAGSGASASIPRTIFKNGKGLQSRAALLGFPPLEDHVIHRIHAEIPPTWATGPEN